MAPSHIVFEGYLQKQSAFLKQARKRWMVLVSDGYLYSYKKQSVYNHATEIFDLNSFYVAVVTTDGDDELGQFELISLNETRIFTASSLEDMNNWITQINNICIINTADQYITRMCSNVLCLSNTQKNGMETYAKLTKMGFNNNELCLMAACKYEKNADKAINFIIQQLNTESIILREHFIQKKSKWIKKWRKRWTVLMFEPYSNICYLTTYKKRKSYKNPTEFILLNEKMQIFIIDKDDTQFCIKLNDRNNTMFLLKTYTIKLRDEWVSLLISRKNNWTLLQDICTPSNHHNIKHKLSSNNDTESGEKKSFTNQTSVN